MERFVNNWAIYQKERKSWNLNWHAKMEGKKEIEKERRNGNGNGKQRLTWISLQVNICWYKSQIDAAFQRMQQGLGPVVSCLLEAYLQCISISSGERSFAMRWIAYQQYFLLTRWGLYSAFRGFPSCWHNCSQRPLKGFPFFSICICPDPSWHSFDSAMRTLSWPFLL